MRLIRLELADFRSFYGAHVLDFSADEKRSVTLFHGENGAGKTNLLNAVHWCMTGKFTPRFQDPNLLVNKEAYKDGRRECHVELSFQDEESTGGKGKMYRVRRSATSDRTTGFDVYEIDNGNSRLVPKGDSLLRRMLPPGLVSWFFFDAEAIGALELSGSEAFKQDLRKTLGFDLVDTLLDDLERVAHKRQREVATQTNDKELRALQDEIDRLDHILPGQHETAIALERDERDLTVQYEEIRKNLSKLPQAGPLEKRRRDLETQVGRLKSEKEAFSIKAAQTVGSAAPALVLLDMTKDLEGKLQEQEIKGRLPSPYSDQLVKDILEAQTCVCGRPITAGSDEEQKIRDLMKFASTGVLNQRIADVRYLLRDIERVGAQFPVDIAAVRERIAEIDAEIGRHEEDIKELARQLADIDVEEIQKLEQGRLRLDKARRDKAAQSGAIRQQIDSNQRRKEELQARYEATSRKLKVNERLKRELDKTNRLIDFIRKSLEKQEKQALLIFSKELNSVLERYLTKHYKAVIDAKTYAVQLLDQDGKRVGHSTGEGQVLKFAFIATVVALAAKKTQQKIEWLSEPTIAPLVLDAPFSALDPEYQGSVARNLAEQTRQLVLMISSAAWGERVASALEPRVGRRYLVVSKEAGPQGKKPVKRLQLNGTDYALNEYGAERAESVFIKVA